MFILFVQRAEVACVQLRVAALATDPHRESAADRVKRCFLWRDKAMPTGEMPRCPWAKTVLYVQYHDTEWGVPVHDDRLLFEFLVLEGAQAGLSWEAILNKRDNDRAAFDHFDPAPIARYGQKKRTS
jgi:hypothetical protein